jgi:DNA-binding XRE family transcriptional regulator
MGSTQKRDASKRRSNAPLRLSKDRCKAMMKRREIKSVAELARQADVSRSQIFRLLSGECGASLRLATKLAEIGRTTVKDLFPVQEAS